MERHKKLLVLIIGLIALLAVSCDMAGIHTGLKDTNLVGTWESEEVSLKETVEADDHGIKAKLTFTKEGDLVVETTQYIKKHTDSVDKWTPEIGKVPEKTTYYVTIIGDKMRIYDIETQKSLDERTYSIENDKLTIFEKDNTNKTVFVKK